MKKLFIWDFHGCLEKGNEKAVLEISNRALKHFGHKERFTEKEMDKLYGLKWWEYFEYILSNESHEKHLELQKACFNFQNASDIVAKYISPNNHAHFVLEEIKKAGHYQILISNTNPESLGLFIKSVKMEEYFSEENSFAVDLHTKTDKTKNDVLEDFIKEKGFDEIIIIGDSQADMELKDVIGGKTYLYSHKEREFRECESDDKINDLREILKEV